MQVIRAATLDVPNQIPPPQLPKQMLYVQPIPAMYIMVRLLPGNPSFLPMNGRVCTSTRPVSFPSQAGVEGKGGKGTARVHPEKNLPDSFLLKRMNLAEFCGAKKIVSLYTPSPLSKQLEKGRN